VTQVGEEFRLSMGQSPPGSTYNEVGEGLPFYQGRTDFTFRYPTRRVYCTAPTRFADPGDTLVCVRAPVGDTNMAFERCAIGRGIAAVRHKSHSRSLTYYAMQALEQELAVFEGEGTLFGAIGGDDFRRLPYVAAPIEVVRSFDALAAPIDDRIEASVNESATLEKLRDTLLPALLSGEVTIKQCERAVAEVA
jgi:type I restriction enzyme S subunit